MNIFFFKLKVGLLSIFTGTPAPTKKWTFIHIHNILVPNALTPLLQFSHFFLVSSDALR